MSERNHIDWIAKLIADAQPSRGVLVEPPHDHCAWFDAVNFVRGVKCGALHWREMPSDGFVYFVAIGLPYITHVKVGFTAGDPEKRLKSLQTGCPYPMRLLGYVFGNVERERDLHNLLGYYRTSGEWFEYDEFVGDMIQAELMQDGCA